MSWTELHSGSIKCTLCPNYCLLGDNKSGICSVRINSGGKLHLPLKGHISALNVDPVEKKPLYHFYPGTQVLSMGFFGCNFHCQFCQNHQISQITDFRKDTFYYSPGDLIEICVEKGIPLIAYTYSEPVIHFEYIMECAEKASEKGIKNVLITNGYINPDPGTELLKLIDGVNVDLKSFSNAFYRQLGGRINPVREFIELASELSHLEITTLIIPGRNDSVEEISKISKFIGELGRTIPLHISRYYPAFNYSIPMGTSDSLNKLIDLALENLEYVYPGNINIEENNTRCLHCGNILIQRRGFRVSVSGIIHSRCSECGNTVPFPV